MKEMSQEETINKDEKLAFKKTNVLFMVVLSHVTFGIYVPYWFLTRRKAFEQLSANSKIPVKAIKCVLVLYILSSLATIVGPFFLTEYGLELKNSLDYILTMYSVGIILYSVFRAKDMINEYFDKTEVKAIPAALFHIWYLQHKINRLFVERDEGHVIKKMVR
jgi:Domain of unknown function (DUF4234)